MYLAIMILAAYNALAVSTDELEGNPHVFDRENEKSHTEKFLKSQGQRVLTATLTLAIHIFL